MAEPAARMRLTVQVLALEAEDAQGPYRAQAVAAFKARSFALPVKLDDTFERIWNQIEKRYKTNYLNAQQAAIFTIKKLQDAYDCDLDLGDTVGSIFEGETDPAMRTIKVIPSSVHRDFSVPVTSNLRPGHVQKRLREINAEHASKRRRMGQHPLDNIQEEIDPSRDQPIPTIESERSGSGSAEQGGTHGTRRSSRLQRSQTGGSMVMVNEMQTGHAEFGAGIKEESPELGLPFFWKPPTAASAENEFKKPPIPVSKTSLRTRQLTKSRSQTSRMLPRAHSEQQAADEVSEPDGVSVQDTHMQEEVAQDGQQDPALAKSGSQKAVLHPSPKATTGGSRRTPSPTTARRRDMYDVPSSPEFMHSQSKSKSKKTYGKSPRDAPPIHEGADLLNNSRLLSDHTQTPDRTTLTTPNRPGSLKKPYRGTSFGTSFGTPSSARRGASSYNREKLAKSSRMRAESNSQNDVSSRVSSAEVVVTPKRLGRPRKDISARPLVISKQRGRPSKTEWRTASGPSQRSTKSTPVVEIATQTAAGTSTPPSNRKIATEAEEVIVISSREPSSTDLGDSEEKQQTTLPEEDQVQDGEEDKLVDAELAQLQLQQSTSSENKLSKGLEPKPGNTESLQPQDAPSDLIDQLRLRAYASSPSQAMNYITTKAEADPAPKADSTSRSASAAISRRSSPAVIHRPARFLSHSPTPDLSESGDESEETSAAVLKDATLPPLEEKDKADERDSSSDSEESGNEDDKDIEMLNVPTEPALDSTASLNDGAVRSSPPRLPHPPPNSTHLVLERSQPTFSQINPSGIRRTPVPLPSPLRSSQSASAHGTARRPTARYTGFKTLSEQLADARKEPVATQTAKAYDPRTMSLGKMAAKAKGAMGAKGVMGIGDGSSDDETSSSSSDSD